MQGGGLRPAEKCGIIIKNAKGSLFMKIKNAKFFLCGLLAALLLIRNIQDGQFVMCFFFAVVAWQCIRASLCAKGLEELDAAALSALRARAEGEVYGALAGAAWMLPYGVLALCASVGALVPGVRMPMVYVFVLALAVELVVGVKVWKKMKALLESGGV